MCLPKLNIHRSIVFDVSIWNSAPWSDKTPCGEFLDVILRILRSDPPYVTGYDARRHMALLCHLKNHRAKVYERGGIEVNEAVEALPLRHLDRALGSWVRSWFSGPHPLVSCYALDAAGFILSHAWGAYEHTSETRESWKITPLLPPSLEEVVCRRSSFRDEPRFKSELTSSIRGVKAIVKVPSRGRCLDHSSQALLGPGDEFIVEVLRCHLSASLEDWPALTAIDDDEPELSLSRDFAIPCEIHARHPGGEQAIILPESWEGRGFRPVVRIPGRWLTHVLTRESWQDPWVPVPLPQWLVGHDAR